MIGESDRAMFEMRLLAEAGKPARLDYRGAAELLGFQEHDIPVLVLNGLLKPLGSPGQNNHKFFSTIQLLRLAADPGWLDRATKTVSKNWKIKNAKKRSIDFQDTGEAE
jgi:hypothetical protein